MSKGDLMPVLCKAHTSAGNPCKRRPINGGTVCATHGGRAPQVRRKAQERINLAADSAAAHLIEWMSDPDVPHNIRLAAAKDLLDRAQIGTDKHATVEVALRKFEQGIGDLLVDVPAVEVVQGSTTSSHLLPGPGSALPVDDEDDGPTPTGSRRLR